MLAFSGGGPRKADLDGAGIEVFVGGSDSHLIENAVALAGKWRPDILHLHRFGYPDPLTAGIVRSLSDPSRRVFETNVFACADNTRDRELFDVHLQLSRWCMWKWKQAAKGLQPPSFSVVVPYSIEVDRFKLLTESDREAVRASFGIPSDAIVFGRIGQTDMMKWSKSLISAFREIATRRKDVWLLVAELPEDLEGSVSSLPQHVRARVVQLKMVDSDEELRRRYSAMDIFVHASKKGESFGMVLCEAMLCGLPVVTVSTPLRDNSQIEVVPNEKAGLVVDGLAGLTRAMLALAEDRDRRRSLGSAGPPWVKDNYSIAKVAPRLVNLAEITLAATSRSELIQAVQNASTFRTSMEEEKLSTILNDAGLSQSPVTNTLLTLIHSSATRSMIKNARWVWSRLRGYRQVLLPTTG